MRHLLLTFLVITSLITYSCRENPSTIPANPSTPAIEVKIDNSKSLNDLRSERDKLRVEINSITTLIEQKEIDTIKKWSTIAGFALSGFSVLCLVASIFLSSYPILPSVLRIVGLILLPMGFVSFLLHYFYLYSISLGGITIITILGISIYIWRRDRRGLVSVVSGVNELKQHTPNYKNILKKHINGSNDKWIDNVRKRL